MRKTRRLGVAQGRVWRKGGRRTAGSSARCAGAVPSRAVAPFSFLCLESPRLPTERLPQASCFQPPGQSDSCLPTVYL